MNEKITSGDLAELLAKRSGISQTAAVRFIRIVFPLISEVLQSEKYLKINGLGTFKLIVVNSRESVNVSTGERILIPSYNKISFTPDAALRDLVNKPFAHFENVELRDDVDFGELDEEEEDGIPEVDSLDQPVRETQNTVSEASVGEEKEIIVEALEEVNAAPEDNKDAPEEKHSAELETDDTTEPAEDGTDGHAEISSEVFAVQSDSVQIKVDSVQIETASVEIHSAATPAAVSIDTSASGKAKEASSEPDSEVGEDEKEKALFSRCLSKTFCICTLILLLLVGVILYISIEKPVWVVRYFAENKELSAPTERMVLPKDSLKSGQLVEQTKTVAKADTDSMNLLDVGEDERVWITSKHADYRDYMLLSENLDTVEIISGTSLIRLAKKYYGCQDLWPLIAEKNNAVLKDPDHLPIGKTLIIPQLKKK